MSGWIATGLRPAAISIVTILLVRPAAAALPDPLVVDRLGREHGFPSETITALHRDHLGFLWVGSREGLAIWDGYDVRVLQHNVSDPSSLADDAVRRIYEDRSGHVWVGTDAGGLQRIDRATWRFQGYRHVASDPRSLGDNGVYAIVEGNDGALWVGTQHGLDRMDVASGTFEHFEANAGNPAALPHPWVYDLHCDKAGRIWAVTVGGGVAWVDPVSRAVTRVPCGAGAETAESCSLAYSIAEDRQGNLWFGMEDGVFRYAAETASLVRVPIREFHAKRDPSIVTSIAFDHEGVLWVSTWNGGLVGYDVASGESRRYRHESEQEGGLATDRLPCLIVDSADVVWIGSWGKGIHRFSAQSAVFKRILEKAGDPKALPYHEITSVLQDREGRLWVGTWGQGLFWRDEPGGAFVPVRASDDTRARMATPLALVEDARGEIWAGTIGGLFRVDRKGDVDQAYRHESNHPDGLGAVYINALSFDGAGRLWIATGGGGLDRLDTDLKTFVHFRNDSHDPASLSDDTITSLLLQDERKLWVGTRGGGLNLLDMTTERVVRFVPDPDNPRSLPQLTVTCLLKDRRGVVWAGTAGGGLARIERSGSGAWEVTRVDVSDGLVNASVTSIREDDDGSLWIGTRGGLSRYEPQTGRFHNYGSGDGLPSLEFRANSSAEGTRELHFGTLGGLLSITRGSAFTPPRPTPTLITAIHTLTGPWPSTVPAWETREIDAPYGTMLSFEFGILDLHPPHRFAYRIQEEDTAWVDLGTRREITFAGLSPGRYSLTVRGLNSRGVWSESAAPLRIRIVPPFWMTWWFRGVAALLVVAVSGLWISLRLNALERRNRELEVLQRDREVALERARSSQEQLHGAYERLRGLTRRLEDAKEEERRRIARELHDEMGQALSAIKINLKALGRRSDDTGTAERVDDALTLVDGIIGHVRALSLDLRPPLIDELGLVPALRGYAEGQSVRSGIDIAVEANASAGDLPNDIAIAAFRIAQESIHNVIRHARAERVTVSIRRDPGRLSLTIRDDGRGFDLAEALERAATGRHLGLLGMRERIEALGGTLEIETSPGRGTALHATIPVKDALHAPS